MSLEIKDLVAGYYRDTVILKSVSIHAEKSKITSIIGPNGAGKSTIMKVIYGFLRPQHGSLSLDGEDLGSVSPKEMINKGVSYIPQERSIFTKLTVEENLKLGSWSFRGDHKLVQDRIESMYERFPPLKEKRNAKAGTMSGGQIRMLEFARALITEPNIMLVDEPTFGVAPKVAAEIYEWLEDLRKSGKTILLVDQNIRQAIRLADYIYVFELGKVVDEGSKEGFQTGQHAMVKKWLFLESLNKRARPHSPGT